MTSREKTRKRRKGSQTVTPNNLTRRQKQILAEKVYDVSNEDAVQDFLKLKALGCGTHKKLTLLGSRVVNRFTAAERLNTVGALKATFYDVWASRRTLKNNIQIQRLLKFYREHRKGYPEEKVWFQVSKLYFSSISIFQPTIAMDIYCQFKPTSVLDFTMGWGGRLVGACALNIPSYIGIDSNKHLRSPYRRLTKFLYPLTKTKMDLRFEDALSVDYTRLDYDLVLTSPPYYNRELYGGGEKKDKSAWDNDFYKPLFERTFQNLKMGGYYCLNIPIEVYERVAVKVLGRATMKQPLPKRMRFQWYKYKEFIYIWRKS
jgi:hypothetical protein